MAVEIGTAYVSVVPSGSKLRPAIQKELGGVESDAKDSGDRSGEGFAGAFSGKLKAIGTTFAGLFAAKKVGEFLADSVGAASDLSESASKVGVVFGDAAGDVQSWAKTASTTLGTTTQQALEAAGTFGNLFTALKIGPDASAKMSKSLVGLAGDLASFNNVDPQEALDALRSGLTGETEPLKRFGVNMNEATLKAKAMELGLSDGKGQLDANVKAQAAYALIMDQTSTAQGDFARTSKGMANQQRILQAQWSDLKARIGQALLPAVNGILRLLTTSLIPTLLSAADAAGPAIATAINGMKDVVGPAIQFLFDHWQGFLTLVSPGLGLAVGLIIGHFDEIKGSFSAFVEAFQSGDGDITSSGLNGYIEGLGLTMRTVVDKIVGALADLPAAVQGFVDSVKTGSADITATGLVGFFDDLGVKVRSIYDFVDAHQATFMVAGAGLGTFAAQALLLQQASGAASTISGIGSAIGGLGSAIGGIVSNAAIFANPYVLIGAAIVAIGVGAFVAYKKFKPFHDAVDAVGRFLKDVGIAAFDAAKTAIKDVGDAAQATGRFFSDAFTTVKDAVTTAVSAVVDTISGVTSKVITALTPLATWFNDNVVSTFAAGWDLVKAVFTQAKDFISTIINGVIIPLFQVWSTAAGTLIDTLVGAFQRMIDVATPIFLAVQALIQGVIGVITDIVTAFVQTVLPVWQGFFDGALLIASTVFDIIKTAIETTLGIIRGIFQALTGLISGDWGKFWDGIQTIASSLFNGVKDTISGVWDLIKGLFTTGIDTAKSTVSAGLDAITGFFQGMPGRISAAASGMFGGITGAFKGAINAIIDGWNSLEFTIPGVNVGPVHFGGFTLGVPDIPHIANGGLVDRGGISLVGERGPERVFLPAGAHVAPHTSGPVGGPPTVINVHLSNVWGDVKSAALQINEELRKLNRSIA